MSEAILLLVLSAFGLVAVGAAIVDGEWGIAQVALVIALVFGITGAALLHDAATQVATERTACELNGHWWSSDGVRINGERHHCLATPPRLATPTDSKNEGEAP